MKLINKHKQSCGFCKERGIIVTDIRVEYNNEVDINPICHTCFNEARYLEKGLYHNGHQIFIDFQAYNNSFSVKMIKDSRWRLGRK